MAIVSHATAGIAMVAFACKYRSDATKYLSVECGLLLIKILNFSEFSTLLGARRLPPQQLKLQVAPVAQQPKP